ncbi:MAG: hypothetical protein ACRCW7_10100 [Cetobacterium sp.]
MLNIVFLKYMISWCISLDYTIQGTKLLFLGQDPNNSGKAESEKKKLS